MKLVRAELRPERLGILSEALRMNGFVPMTVIPIGHDKMRSLPMRELCKRLAREDILPRIQVEILLDPERVDLLTGIILESCRTGNAGDGRILVLPFDDAIRIRTGESISNHRIASDTLPEKTGGPYRVKSGESTSTDAQHTPTAELKGAR